MTETKPHIAIIGAGLASTTLADVLTSNDIEVSVYEKSRGTGGRLSSCKLDEMSADLGAPFISTNNSDFSTWLAESGVLETWSPISKSFDGEELQSPNLITGSSRLSSLTRHLLAHANFHPATRVGYIWPELDGSQKKVRLRDEKGESLGVFDAAIVTAPAQQAATLLEAVPRFSNTAKAITPSASWVILLETTDSLDQPEQLITGHHPILNRCIKESAKPGRNNVNGTAIWSIEAIPDWSQEHINLPKEEIEILLTQAFVSVKPEAKVLSVRRCHRWLYSRHPKTEHGMLWDEATHIGACGDWLLGGDLEGAWESAKKLSTKLISCLGNKLRSINS
ncbi:NAD(P)/FAD-dependent oxidoreductase [Neptuniibacter sp. QD57_21]|uniref:NAD(P)/FAD-dependent oxidoreductase n=1 Tax=Neptuniibacter sp. QD57_21 TaxID=3398213 RepID=UPI0039F45DEF